MVDIHREGCSRRPAPQNRHTAPLRSHAPCQRPAPQSRHTAPLRSHARCTPRKPSGWDRGGGKPQPPTRDDRAQTWYGHKTQAQPSLRLCGVPKNLNLSSLDLGRACNPGMASDSSQQSNLESAQCRLGKHTCLSGGKPSVAESL